MQAQEERYRQIRISIQWCYAERTKVAKHTDHLSRKAAIVYILNSDLWEQLLGLLERHQVTFVWVKGHAGHPENERCDQLAVQASMLAAGQA